MKKVKNNYKSKNRHKFLIKYYFIFSIKYRKTLLVTIGEWVKGEILRISDKSDFSIDVVEVDKDHIHILVDSPPNLSPSSIARKLKQETSYNIYRSEFKYLLDGAFRKENTLWSDGYFVCTTGDVSTEVVRNYIEQQG